MLDQPTQLFADLMATDLPISPGAFGLSRGLPPPFLPIFLCATDRPKIVSSHKEWRKKEGAYALIEAMAMMMNGLCLDWPIPYNLPHI